MRAVTDVRMAAIAPDDFTDLVLTQRAVHRRVMRAVRTVSARTAAREQNRERLASLGTMAAGLAHELNNPAAAARRAASDLAEALDVLASTIGLFVESGIEREQAGELVAMQRDAIERAAAGDSMSALDAADAEDELLDALEELGVTEPWRLTEPLVAAGIDAEWLERLEQSAGPATVRRRRWVAASLTAQGLAGEIAESTDRMGKLVKAIKAYAFMDRGELVETDIHEGLETTLLVLGHKLKHTAIEVGRDYDRSLPKLTLRGSELNQVWTNLLANAIEALGEHGTIEIGTARDGACARVDIIDDGPGIPDEIRGRVFDPFFTTKASARAPAWASTPPGGSSPSGSAARSSSSPSPGEPCFTSGCRSTGGRSRPANRRNAEKTAASSAAAGLRDCKPAHRKGSLGASRTRTVSTSSVIDAGALSPRIHPISRDL